MVEFDNKGSAICLPKDASNALILPDAYRIINEQREIGRKISLNQLKRTELKDFTFKL